MRKFCFLLLMIMIFATVSCRNLLYKYVGIEPIEKFDTVRYEKMESFFKEKYENTTSFISTDSLFKNYIKDFGEFKNNETYQPLQILYFKNDLLSSYHANCYAKQSMNGSFNWNYDGKFDRFFPRTAVEIENNKGLNYIVKNFGLTVTTEEITIVFFWSNFLGRESKKAFETIVDNLNKYSQLTKPRIIAINTDYTFIEDDLLSK